KLHLLQVSGEMFGANSVPSANDSALKQRERRFYGISVNVTSYIDLIFVANGLVPISLTAHCEGIRGMFIGDNHINIFAHIVCNNLVDGVGLYIVCMDEANVAAALPDADHN